MNRRGFIKGTGAIAATPLIAKLSGGTISAQAPMFEGEVIYEFTELAGATYDASMDGRVHNVAKNGLIVGADRVDGRLAPCTWDLAGTRTVLDTGALEFGAWNYTIVSPSGQLAGSYRPVEDDFTKLTAVSWASGTGENLPNEGGSSTSASSINDAASVAGLIDGRPARWTSTGTETFESPAEAPYAIIGAVDDHGNVFGLFMNSEVQAVGNLWRWNADGSLEELNWPDELLSAAPDSISGLWTGIRTTFENGDFILSARWTAGETSFDRSWFGSTIGYTLLTSDGNDVEFRATSALTPDRVFGYRHTPEMERLPAVWENGSVNLLRDISILPDGVDMAALIGVTGDGSLVAMTSLAEANPRLLALHPV